MFDFILKIIALDQASSVMRSVAEQAEAIGKSTTTAQAAQQAGLASSATAMGESLTRIGALGTLAAKPLVSSFSELEDSATRLKSVMMDRTGVVSSNFAELDRQATELGKKLPGSTKDFYDLASSMLALGMTPETLLRGGLKSAAYLGVITRGFGEDYTKAGESVAKFKESLGIADEDTIKFMDTIQRMRHLGVPLQDLKYTFARMGGEIKSLGLQGLQSANDIAPLAVSIFKTGASGQITGSSLNSLMRQLAMFPIIQAKKRYTEQAAPILQNYGIDLKFVGNDGKFLGIQNMVGQFDKLKKLSGLERSIVLDVMFGAGGDANAAKYLIGMGISGYQQIQQQMQNQADLNQRVTMSLQTQNNTWDALSGTLRGTLALLGGAMAPALKSTMNYFNNFTASIAEFVQRHPRFTSALVTGAVGLFSFALLLGGLAFSTGKIFLLLTESATAMRNFGGAALRAAAPLRDLVAGINFSAARRAIVGMGEALLEQVVYRSLQAGDALRAMRAGLASGGATSVLTQGFSAVMQGWMRMNFAFLFSPAGIAIAALAVGAFLLIKNWTVVSAFFRGIGDGLKAAFAAPWAALQGVRAAFAPIIPLLQGAWTWIQRLFTPFQATTGQIRSATNAGVVFGQFLGTALRVVVTPIMVVLQLFGMLFSFILRTATAGNVLGRVIASAFTLMFAPIRTAYTLIVALVKGALALFDGKTWGEAGKIAVDALWNGMTEMFGKIIDGIKGVADTVLGFFGVKKNAEQTAATQQTAQQVAKTAQTQPAKPPVAPQQIQAPVPLAARQLLVKPAAAPALEQFEDLANSPAMGANVSALQSQQIAESIMDIPRVSYASAPKQPKPILMGGRFGTGKIIAPSVPRTVDGQTIYSVPIEQGASRRAEADAVRQEQGLAPLPSTRRSGGRRRSTDAEREPASSSSPIPSKASAPPMTFNFNFNLNGNGGETIPQQIRSVIDEKLPDIKRAIEESLSSSRLKFGTL